jgi:hypothetical protein
MRIARFEPVRCQIRESQADEKEWCESARSAVRSRPGTKFRLATAREIRLIVEHHLWNALHLCRALKGIAVHHPGMIRAGDVFVARFGYRERKSDRRESRSSKLYRVRWARERLPQSSS